MSQSPGAKEPELLVRVRFFGAVAEMVGRKECSVHLSDGFTVGDVHAGLLADHPKLEGFQVLYAVDQEYCSGAHVLTGGEELAIFSAVSGG